MKTVNFLGIETSRLILGANPFAGFSYIETVTRDEMLDYYTTEKIIAALRHAEALGYTALVATADDFTRRYLRQYKNEGGKMKWIAQTHAPLLMAVSVNNAIEGGAVAIFHQGTSGDTLFENKQYDTLRANLAEMRRAGVPVGIATHVPEHVEIAEREFETDFYMASLHNLRRGEAGRVSSSISGLKDEKRRFLREDRAAMFDTIRSLSKPCIAYKILGGGNYAFEREELRQCFVETYANIKPGDIALVGAFQRDHDQIRENMDIVADILK